MPPSASSTSTLGTGRLDPEEVAAALTDRTRLVAITHASNAIGTVVDVASVVEAAHAVGALAFVDAVHYAPHGLIDVVATGCDFLAASAYKFFGPHTGIMYGRADLLAGLDAVKIRPAPSEAPGQVGERHPELREPRRGDRRRRLPRLVGRR